MKTFRNPQALGAAPAAYSHQVEIDKNERLLILSGQTGMRPDGTLSKDPIEQVDQALQNVIRNLEAAGMGVEDILKLTLFLVGDVDNTKRRAVTAQRMAGHKPCSTVVFVAGLVSPEMRVEIDAIASKTVK